MFKRVQSALWCLHIINSVTKSNHSRYTKGEEALVFQKYKKREMTLNDKLQYVIL